MTDTNEKIKVNIIYDNFINKYTNKVYPLGETEISKERLNEILDVERKNGVKLIEIIDNKNTNNGEQDIEVNESDEQDTDTNENGEQDVDTNEEDAQDIKTNENNNGKKKKASKK